MTAHSSVLRGDGSAGEGDGATAPSRFLRAWAELARMLMSAASGRMSLDARGLEAEGLAGDGEDHGPYVGPSWRMSAAPSRVRSRRRLAVLG